MVRLTDLAPLFAQGADDPRSDSELLAAYRIDRDETAFERIVARHARAVWAVCRRVLRNPADAEDAFQATFVVLARSAHRVPDGPAVGGWLCGVALRVASKGVVMAARRRRREGRAARPEGFVAPGPADPDLPAVLGEELGRLAERDRLAVVLCDLEGLTERAAAARLGWAEGTLSSRLHRARRRLADRLRARGMAGAVAAGIGGAGDVRAGVPQRLVAAAVAAVRSGPAATLPSGASTVERLAQTVMWETAVRGARRVLTAAVLLTVAVVATGLCSSGGERARAAPTPGGRAEPDAAATGMRSPAPAIPAATPAMAALLARRDVLRELRCTPEQRVALDDHADEQAAERERHLAALFAVVFEGRGQGVVTPQQAWAAFLAAQDDAAAARRAKGAEVLTPTQLARLAQVELQVRGVAAFADPAVADALQLTAAQRAGVAEAVRRARDERSGRPKATGVYDEPDGRGVRLGFDGSGRAGAYRAVESDLTAPQKAAWRRMAGEPVVAFDPFSTK